MSPVQLGLGPNKLGSALGNIVAEQSLASIASSKAPISNVGPLFVRNNLIGPLPHEWRNEEIIRFITNPLRQGYK